MGITAPGLPGRRGKERRECGLNEASVCCNALWLMLFIERALENKRGTSKSASWCLPEAFLPGVCVAGRTDFLPKACVEDREKKGRLRADLKTGSEVGVCQMAFSPE